ncbi:MAG TPA: bifunctional nuclease family protein [Chitinophagales bacterium]|nr:bifunctional nuclease family protein [Chitinophagales bacterium]
MKKVELEIINVTQGFTQHHSYAVLLGEKNGKRRLPIVIGATEAQAIVVAIENMPPARPLTHDLMKNIMDTFNVFLSEIVITNLLDGIFYSKLVCIFNGEEHEIDSRTSDALALAARYSCPIYIYGNIFEMSGIVLMEGAEVEETEIMQEPTSNTYTEKSDYSIYTHKELETLMNEAINNEDYEKAAAIRDELSKR